MKITLKINRCFVIVGLKVGKGGKVLRYLKVGNYLQREIAAGGAQSTNSSPTNPEDSPGSFGVRVGQPLEHQPTATE